MKISTRLASFIALYPTFWLLAALPLAYLLTYIGESYPTNQVAKSLIWVVIPLHLLAGIFMTCGAFFFYFDATRRLADKGFVRILWLVSIAMMPLISMPIYWHSIYRHSS